MVLNSYYIIRYIIIYISYYTIRKFKNYFNAVKLSITKYVIFPIKA